MIFLKTNRLILRNVEKKDAEEIFDYRNNDVCSKYQRGQTKDFEGIVNLCEKRMHDKLSITSPSMIAVSLNETDQIIGEIIVMPNDNTISLGYTFSYKIHRRGYAYEALSALIDYLHSIFPEHGFICHTDTENVASMELLKKLGYSEYGYEISEDSRVFGKWLGKIRKAKATDISRIAEILVFSKRINYRSIFRNDLYSFGELQVLSVADEYHNNAKLLEETWVYEDIFVKGLVQIAEKEVKKLYVDDFFISEGIGGKLIEFAINQFDVNHLWVLEKNKRAISFYENHGFRYLKSWEYEKGTSERLLKLERG